MKSYKYAHIVTALVAVIATICAGCSTEKNTSQTRWWHSFHARYNTYYNGSVAYIEGSLEKENGNKDNFTEIIPLYTVGNKGSRELGASNFDRAIEKSQKAIKRHSIKRRPEWTKSRKKTERDIEWLNRREYNPFLWKAWMLMGRSQFMKGSFDEAASTFAYMARLYSTQPAIYGKARAWLAKCYIEQDWIYDAEDVITKMRRDSIHWRAKKEWDYTLADYYIRTSRFKEAIPYLRKVIKHEMRRKQRAREWFLMGQLHAAIGNKEEAYKAFRHVIRQHPPYELEFNARIAMTEVMGAGRSKQMISRLKRMAASDNNKDYLDQVYYAIGNIYLSQRDTVNAISAYEKGNSKSVRNGIEKGVLLLNLGDLYWAKEDFSNARRCYGEAIGLLDKDREDYGQLSERSKILDELVPYTDAVHLQDSLQALAKMPEKERNAAIDRVIEALKKKEKAERDAQAEADAQQQLAQNGGSNVQQNTTTFPNKTQGQGGQWYFYNPMAVNQGKSAFQRLWGKRENVDDWQRVNKTVVATPGTMDELTDAQRDSIFMAEAAEDSLKHVLDSAQNNPHKREYYLAQIPFSEEQVAASNLIIEDGLYHSGVIFKDKLDNLRLSEKSLRRLTDNYPDFVNMDEALYHLFLLYSRKGDRATASAYLERLKLHHADSKWTALLSDPYFEENARYGTHIEDSVYAATYEAFKADRFDEVRRNGEISESRFPLGANRDKFIFIGGLSKLNNGDTRGCLEDMNKVVADYPQSDVSPLAGMIINGVKGGRRLHGAKFDIGNVWERRADVMSDSDSVAVRKFVPERNADFSFIIAYQPDSLNENRLLFELARYNFSNFLVRNFDIAIEDFDGLHRMMVKGFKSYDEVLQYARRLYTNKNITRLMEKSRVIIISEKNLELLGTQFSYNDYDKFYEKHFIPLRISTVHLLTEPATIEYERAPENAEEPEDGLYNGGVVDDDTYLNLGVDDAPEDNGAVAVPEEETVAGQPSDDVVVPDDSTPPAPAADDDTFVVPEDAPAGSVTDTTVVAGEEPVTVPEPVSVPVPQPVTVQPKPAVAPPAKPAAAPKQRTEPQKNITPVPQQEDTGIDFSDDVETVAPPANQKNSNKTEPVYDIEDEYYELDGF